MEFFEVKTWFSDKSFTMPQLHEHEYYELYFLVDGNKRFICQNRVFEVKKGSLVVTKPYSLHMFEGGPFKRVLVSVSPNLLSAHQIDFLNELADTAPVCTFPKKIMTQLTKLLSSMIKNKNIAGENDLTCHLSFDYLLYLINKYKEPYEPEGIQKMDVVMHPTVIKVVDYINRHYTEKILLSELCDAFHISKTWLCKNFLKSMHTSITSYQTILRINKAKEYLTQTTCPINHISDKLGFSSPKYFGLAFKKATDCSPLEYRKRAR